MTRYHHVSQLYDHKDGFGLTGNNNCFEASTARYLREAGYPFPGTDEQLIEQVRQRATNRPDAGAHNSYTSIEQGANYLSSLGVLEGAGLLRPTRPWTILLVRGVELAPRQFDPSWFGGVDMPDHYILVLDTPPLVNDPLAFFNGQEDCRYSSLVAACKDGYGLELADPCKIAWVESTPGHYKAIPLAPPKPPVPALAHIVTSQVANIRSQPNSSAPILAQVKEGQAVFLAAGQDKGPWWVVSLPGGGTGYLSQSVVKSVAK